VDRAAWRELAGLGVFGLLVPAPTVAAGSVWSTPRSCSRQLGAHLVNGPVLWSTLAAPYVDGRRAGRFARRRCRAGRDGRRSDLVEHAGEVDALLILRDDGIFVCAGSELPGFDLLTPLDPLTPVGRVAHLPRGTRVGDARDAAELRRVGRVLCAALLLGVSSTALETSRRYALDREQFGVPIGSFQAIQHILADMYVRGSLARSATYAAAAVLDDPEISDPECATAVAKLLAGEAAIENARAAIQVHGGVGFTWEDASELPSQARLGARARVR